VSSSRPSAPRQAQALNRFLTIFLRRICYAVVSEAGEPFASFLLHLKRGQSIGVELPVSDGV
jgi:hypothetical protein